MTQTADLRRDLCAGLGVCLEYPGDGSREAAQTTGGRLAPVSAQAAAHMKEFCAWICAMDLGPWQEHYVRTFDVMPQCAPYLSVHLFGEENFRRADLMAGLKGVYERQGPCGLAELPDHLAVVLKQNALFGEEEWEELASLCLLPVLAKMLGELEKNANPYALVLKAVRAVLSEEGHAHA